MAINLMECPHCCTRVVPMADGTCPACRKNSQETPAAKSHAEISLSVGARRSDPWRDHARHVLGLSSDLGYAYSAEVTRDDVPAMPLFENWSGGSNGMNGLRNGVSVQILDFTTEVDAGEDTKTVYATVALVEGLKLGEFDLRPLNSVPRLLRWAGIKGLTFDSASLGNFPDRETVTRFGEFFHLMDVHVKSWIELCGDERFVPVENEQALRRLFTPRTMEVLNRNPHYSVQALGGHLAVLHDGTLSGGLRSKFLDSTLAIHAALTEATEVKTGRTEVPGCPGKEPLRQARRLRNIMNGCGLGSVVGFILAAANFCAVGLWPNLVQGFGPGAFVLIPVILFGSPLAGMGVGAVWGLLVPVPHALELRDQPYEDPQREATRKRITGVIANIGLFLGSFIGMAVVVAFACDSNSNWDLHHDDEAPVRWLFGMFGAIIGGAVFGAILAGCGTDLVYRCFFSRRSDHR